MRKLNTLKLIRTLAMLGAIVVCSTGCNAIYNVPEFFDWGAAREAGVPVPDLDGSDTLNLVMAQGDHTTRHGDVVMNELERCMHYGGAFLDYNAITMQIICHRVDF